MDPEKGRSTRRRGRVKTGDDTFVATLESSPPSLEQERLHGETHPKFSMCLILQKIVPKMFTILRSGMEGICDKNREN